MVRRGRENRPILRRSERRSRMPSPHEFDFATTVGWLTSEAPRIGGSLASRTGCRCQNPGKGNPAGASVLVGRRECFRDLFS